MNALLLINPGARRNKTGGDETLRQEARQEKITIVDIPRPHESGGYLPVLTERRPDILFVSGGDGTCQAVVTVLAEQLDPSLWPKLVFLPHGTTNMTANDISVRKPGSGQVGHVMALARHGRLAPHLVRRRTVRVAGLRDGAVQHGFFAGAGAVARAARQNQRDLNARGIKGNVAAGLTMLRAIGAALRGDVSSDGLMRDEPMVLSAANRPVVDGRVLLVLMSTLETLVLGARPFWNQGDAPLHVTHVRKPLTALATSLPKLMYGGPQRRLPPAYTSFGTSQLALSLSSDILIDGEFYAPGADPLRIGAGPQFEFVRL